MPVRYKYYYYNVYDDGSGLSVIGTNEHSEMVKAGFPNEYSVLETFVIGKKMIHLKFMHKPDTWDSDNKPYCFVIHQYNLAVNSQPLYEARYNHYIVAIANYDDIKTRISNLVNHKAPVTKPFPDLTPYLNSSNVKDIPLELAAQNPVTVPVGKMLSIIDAAQDEYGLFLYPLYAKINHPSEQFWVQMIKRDTKYYGIVVNYIHDKEAIGFTYGDVVSFGVPHIKQLI